MPQIEKTSLFAKLESDLRGDECVQSMPGFGLQRLVMLCWYPKRPWLNTWFVGSTGQLFVSWNHFYEGNRRLKYFWPLWAAGHQHIFLKRIDSLHAT